MSRQYPRWIHHLSGRSVIVNSPDHEAAQGEGWYDTPADFPASEAVLEPVPALPDNNGPAEKVKGKPGPKPKVKG
jgi:hypothetical protein